MIIKRVIIKSFEVGLISTMLGSIIYILATIFYV